MAILPRRMEIAVERLRAAFDPEEIVLFGSRAYGMPRPDSDIDLLVVLRHPADSIDARTRRAREVLGEDGWRQVDGHVWAYTPNEMHEQLRRGSTAVRDALAKGERLFPEGGRSQYAALVEEWSATGAAETLLDKAEDDLETAAVMLSNAMGRGRGWWVAAFHAQQAVEKALKALIYHLGGEPERTHSLSELAVRASEIDPGRGRTLFLKYQPRLAELGKHAVQPRYVDVPPVSADQARAAFETAHDVMEDVRAMVSA